MFGLIKEFRTSNNEVIKNIYSLTDIFTSVVCSVCSDYLYNLTTTLSYKLRGTIYPSYA